MGGAAAAAAAAADWVVVLILTLLNAETMREIQQSGGLVERKADRREPLPDAHTHAHAHTAHTHNRHGEKQRRRHVRWRVLYTRNAARA